MFVFRVFIYKFLYIYIWNNDKYFEYYEKDCFFMPPYIDWFNVYGPKKWFIWQKRGFFIKVIYDNEVKY